MQETPELELVDPNYRPVSALAIASLLFAAVSVAALFHLAFVIFCLIGIVLASLGIMQMNRSDKQYVGANLAWVSIFVCCLFACASISFFMWKNEHRWNLARAHADQWLEMIQQGKTREVHHLTLPHFDRQPPDVDLAVYYAPENLAPNPTIRGRQPQTGYKSYWEVLEPQRTILAEGTRGTIEFLRRDQYRKTSDGELFTLVYRYIPADKSLRRKTNIGRNNATITFPLEFRVRMHRSHATASSGVQWHVHEVSIENVQQTNEEIEIQ